VFQYLSAFREMKSFRALFCLLILFPIFLEANRYLEEPCGPSPITYKIFNGSNAEQSGWMAFICSSNIFLCGGSLIHKRLYLIKKTLSLFNYVYFQALY